MGLLQKKVCMIGDFAVGKTSLVQRLVRSTFSSRYQTTVGVKVDTKVVHLDPVGKDAGTARRCKLVLWDIAGEAEISSLSRLYLRGAAGYLLVVDGTRRETLETALHLQREVQQVTGPIPFVVLINKHDLQAEWELAPGDIEALRTRGWVVFLTSAKTGDGVRQGFEVLARSITE